MTQNVTQRSAISGGKIYLVKTIANFSNVDSGEFPNFQIDILANSFEEELVEATPRGFTLSLDGVISTTSKALYNKLSYARILIGSHL